MRPKPLIPTRTVMRRSPSAVKVPGEGGQDHLNGLLLIKHLGAQAGLGVGYAKLGGPFISRSQQSPDPPRNGIFGQRRFMHLTQLLQAGLLVLDAQQTSGSEMVRYVLTQDLQCPLHSGARRDRGPSGAPQVGIVEIRQPVRRSSYLAA